MQPLPLEHLSTDGSQSENDSPTVRAATVCKKRARDKSEEDKTISANQMKRRSKIMRIGGSPLEQHVPAQVKDALSFRDMSPVKDDREESATLPGDSAIGTERLDSDQKDFIRQWYTTFAKSKSQTLLSSDSMSALSTLTQARPQLILAYIRDLCSDISDSNQPPIIQEYGTVSTQQHLSSCIQKPYILSTANDHLPQTTLHLVNKYINTCRRIRPRTDRRRSVNSGPYRCTFGCGYRTKRTFDWRRHEETHEPQELWLCTLCQKHSDKMDEQKDTDGSRKEPFLVSRKDKFLRHARECHKDWLSERVLDISRVDYRPRGELDCPRCGVRSRSWDERCRHVLGHFEDEVEQGVKRPDIVSEGSREGRPSVDGSVTPQSVVADSSEDERQKMGPSTLNSAN